MNWTEPAFVLNATSFSENALRVTLLAQTHGLFHGIVKYGARKRSIFDVGNHVLATWNARLAEHMGTIKAELITPYAAYSMHDMGRLNALADACKLMAHFLPERLPEAPVYKAFHHLSEVIAREPHWQKDHAMFEHELLHSIGYGLDLEVCAATGQREDLIYVSPKSGRAVSREAGKPYHEKLFPLPAFLLDETAAATAKDISDCYALSQFFFERAAKELHKKVPNRERYAHETQ